MLAAELGRPTASKVKLLADELIVVEPLAATLRFVPSGPTSKLPTLQLAAG